MDLPSRMMVMESAICSISLSLWLIMMQVTPLERSPAMRSSRCWESPSLSADGGLVEDEQLDVLGQRLGDLDQLLLADADVLDLGVGVLVEPDPGEQLARALGASSSS